MVLAGEADSSRETDPGLAFVYDACYKQIQTEYGPDGSHPQLFHNLAHTFEDVYPASLRLIAEALRRGSISPRSARNLQAAMMGHDLVHHLGKHKDEAASAEMLAGFMRDSGHFAVADIEQSRSVVMQTVAYPENGVIIHPNLVDRLGRLGADSDLWGLSAPRLHAWDLGIRIHKEIEDDFDPDDPVQLRKHVEDQLELTQNHRYKTPEARDLFGPGLADNIALYTKLLDEIKSGKKLGELSLL